MIRVLILLVSMSFLFLSCGDNLIEKVEETYPSNKPKAVSFYKLVDGKEMKVQEKEYYENGQLRMGGEIKDGEKTGVWEAYFEDGTLWSKGEFVNGLRTGYGENYYPNGKMREEGEYKDGKQVGKWKYYNEQGILVEERMK
jgi:antitoxin component YwqK of YwqJK toxin-antitoxin module